MTFIEDNFIARKSEVPIEQTQTSATWGLDRVDQTERALSTSYSYTYTGQGVYAYVVDTGINPNHQDFWVSASNTSSRVVLGASFISGAPTAADDEGHGTHCAGTVGGLRWGVAKEATLVAVKVLSSSGSGSYDGVIAGINWVVNNPPGVPNSRKVINLSLGGPAASNVDQAVMSAVSAGRDSKLWCL